MSEENDDKERGAWWVFGLGGAGALALLLAYIRFRNGFTVGTLEAHAQLGDALGPVVAFLTLFTVVAALWSVQIQRVELALQRQELRDTREEMKEQRKQFERTAQAQEKLAASQARLANGQEAANRVTEQLVDAQRSVALEQVAANKIAVRSQLAQRHATIATLQAAIANINAAITASWNPGSGDERAKRDLAADLSALRLRLKTETDVAEALVQIIEPLDEEKLT